MIVEGVLAAVEAAVVEGGLRPRYPQRHRLPARHPHHVRRRVLFNFEFYARIEERKINVRTTMI